MENTNLNRAKKEKNDEFYTQLVDIEKELQHYTNELRGKSIYCNCDSEDSNFWVYFRREFKALGLKKLTATCYNKNGRGMKIEMSEDGSITRDMLNGDGGFGSEECIALLKECDIVVTNPPFSLFQKYIALLEQHNKKYLVIGNINAITYKEIFPLIKTERIWLGASGRINHFVGPDDTGALVKKSASGIWFTNMDNKSRHEPIRFVCSYKGNENKYPKYDNYNAINIDKTREIPIDYYGVMGVPISYLDKHCPEQFEIVERFSPSVGGKRKYKRMFIKRIEEKK